MAKKATKENVTQEFDHFEGHMGETEGYEDMTLDTMAVPFLRILQSGSPQVKKAKPEYMPEAEEGQIFNTISMNLFDAPLRIVVGKFERYYIEWEPNRGPFVQAHDPKLVEGEMAPDLFRDEKKRLTHHKTGNNFKEHYIYYVLLPDFMEEGVCILSLSGTQIKEAKKLNRRLRTTVIPGRAIKALPHFMIWALEVVPRSNDQGDWMGIQFSFDSFVDGVFLQEIAHERKELPNKQVDLAQLEERTVESSDEEEGDDVKY